MDVTRLLMDELTRETARSRRALEQVPDGQRDWKPHDRSMAFGYLADMIAMIPSWLTMIITKDEHDIAPKGAPSQHDSGFTTSAQYIEALDKAVAEARRALEGTTAAHLATHWKLLAGGTVVSNVTRLEMFSDTINHWAHHRGQMTVYLRLMGAKVPALYGPSADDAHFA